MRFSLLILVLLVSLPAHAADMGCTLIRSYPDGKAIHEAGDCRTQRSPASTFKVPLALIGFDSGVLKDAHNPSYNYSEAEDEFTEREKMVTDPTIWLKQSIVWYSQKLTRALGAEKFDAYVHKLNYGNMDLGGNAGKNDGLTQSWLFSSLMISPYEQTDFIFGLLQQKFDISLAAYEQTLAIMPVFEVDGWRVYGKTGSGWLRDATGDSDKTKPQGWFVGWAEKGEKRIVFAKLLLQSEPLKGYGGPAARDAFLALLPQLVQ